MADLRDVKSGDTVCFVETWRREPPVHVVEVTKVGRKWAYFSLYHSTYKFDRESGEVASDGCNSPGRCYRTREEYEAEVAREKAWDELRTYMRETWRAPEHLAADEIMAVTARLRGADHA